MESESLDYWKSQANHFEQKANEIQLELDEYTENSAQLEKELEASLLQTEKQNRDLEHQNQRLKNEIENLRNKLERSQHETNALESELQELKIEKEKQAQYVRELEQKNDDLERGQRVISESVSCIESLLNQAYERNAVLENEVDEIENLRVKLQRANDEARDLKQELVVMEKHPVHKKEDGSTAEAPILNGHSTSAPRTQVDTEIQTMLPTPKREINGNAMTPSSRVTAINIVGDLLRKVGLERFLCRECGKVKCSCETTPAPDVPVQSDTACDEKEVDNVEYRKQRLTRQISDPDAGVGLPPKAPSPIRHSASQQPFSRYGDSGKMRRSFAVRSREGIENLFSLASSKKNQDQGRQKSTLKQ